MTYKKKLIEVALPLEEINKACVHEKSVPRRGHPATMHLWWARRPLAAARAIIFASLVDDPSNYMQGKKAEKERSRLFKLISQLVKWENTSNDKLLGKAIDQIKQSNNNIPPLLDPFCGGGTIPLEGQRLGLKIYAQDLNPIPVIIAKSLIDLPTKYSGRPASNPIAKKENIGNWNHLNGLIADIKKYGSQINDEAKEILNKYYPESPNKETIVAWIWARSIKCPNPICNKDTPLIKSFWLSTKEKKPIWINYKVEKGELIFWIERKKGKPSDNVVTRNGAKCLHCNSHIDFKHVRNEASKGRMNQKLIGIVTDAVRSRNYIPGDKIQESIALKVPDVPNIDMDLPEKALGFRIQNYGMKKFRDLFTKRQLLVLYTISDLILKKRDQILIDSNNDEEYADAVITYLSFARDKLCDWSSSICSWIPRIEGVRPTFPRPAISMSWDFVEINPFSNSIGNFLNHLNWVGEGLKNLPKKCKKGTVVQGDARVSLPDGQFIISTDPPYYDNIGYADLSDFFYVWLRLTLKKAYPNIFSTLLTPKAQELIANPFRCEGSRDKANKFFLEGLRDSFKLISSRADKNYPITIYYAFKQIENEEEKTHSTGWEAMLEGLLSSNLKIVGTWPIRTERVGRARDFSSNALASSIVIVCRPRSETASISTRRELIKNLKKELPPALKNLQEAGIAPVDMAQSAIGPGMAVFSRYSKVLEADGTPMSVRTALQIINQELDSFLTEQESDMDRETRFCVAWYKQFGWKEGPFGDANTLATAKGTAVNALDTAEVVYAKAGKVRLLKRSELDDDWDPTTDKKLTVWECVQHLIKRLDQEGEDSAAKIIRKIGGLAESVKELTYRLYSMCEKKGWTEDGVAYNSLISSWQSISDKAQHYDKVSEETKKRLKDKTQKKLNDL